MSRIYYVASDTDADDPTEPAHTFWFDEDRADRYPGKKEWNGSGLADVNTGEQHRGQAIYRTAQGRWILERWSHHQGEDNYCTLMYYEVDVRSWLTRNEHDDVVERYWGAVEEERGPGRPEVGGRVTISLGDALPKVDAWAAEHGTSRADAVRRLVGEALDS